MRLAAEDALARELSSRGMRGFAGYNILSEEELKDQEKAKRILEEQGIEGAVLMQVVGQHQEVYQSPGALMATGTYAYPTFWGYWGYGWTSTYVPGQIGTDTVVRVETLIYSVSQNQLLWAGTSKTTNPKDLDKAIRGLVDAAGKEIRKAGLVAK
jgi:hypothetical protein